VNPRDSSWHRVVGVLVANDCAAARDNPDLAIAYCTHRAFFKIVAYQYGSAAWNTYMNMLAAPTETPTTWGSPRP
jgi:hypothetical protein